MPKPIPLKLVIKVLERNGFFIVSQKGSHAKFRKIASQTHTVIVKMSKKEIPHGTFYQSILPKSGLSESDFKKTKKK
ncbi:MAG: type II toxin-antitoxin system HicA family toxin [bacterium]|nr:type II toxin-antitoxin system HicA family toxin [bacterium]